MNQAEVGTGATLDCPHVCCVLGMFSNLSEPWFSPLKNGARNRRPYPRGCPALTLAEQLWKREALDPREMTLPLQGRCPKVCSAEALPLPAALLRPLAPGRVIQSRECQPLLPSAPLSPVCPDEGCPKGRMRGREPAVITETWQRDPGGSHCAVYLSSQSQAWGRRCSACRDCDPSPRTGQVPTSLSGTQPPRLRVSRLVSHAPEGLE